SLACFYLLALRLPMHAEVVLNELAASTSERQLLWNSDGTARVGTARVWSDPAFNDSAWQTGSLPAGWGYSVSTNLQSAMRGKTPSLYLRKSFDFTGAPATGILALSLEIDDGCVVYLNGTELTRQNLGTNTGGTKVFVYASQPAFNAATNTGTQNLNFNSAPPLLVNGTNVLAIQAHNASLTSSFKVNAGISLDGTPLVPASDSGWKYFVGRAEPSGGVFDPALIDDTTPPPAGSEDDFDNPQRFVDWVELKNTGAAAVDLSDWSLSDSAGNSAKWKFPAGTTISAGGTLLVLCDGRDEANGTATYLHASFSLSGDGEFLGLFDASGLQRDALAPFPNQSGFYTYGRLPSGTGAWAYQEIATPGADNEGATLAGIVDAPAFKSADGSADLKGGFYSGAQTLVLKSNTPGATIRYTLNGSDPTETSTLYEGPIPITPASDRVGRAIRARAFRDGWIPSKMKTNTYLINQNAALQTLPALVLTGQQDHSFTFPFGIMTIFQGTYVGDLWQSSGPSSFNIPINQGTAFEREITAELLQPDGSPGFRDDVGIRISASPYTRPRLRLTSFNSSPWPISDPNQKPSFNLFWRDDYGPSRLNYPLFPGYSVASFKQLRLRSGKNDIRNPFICDELVRRLFIDMGWVGSRGLFTALYVNGSFKGYYNPCERIREPMLQEHFRSTEPWDVLYNNEFVDGDATEWNTLQTLLSRTLDQPTNYAAVKAKADLEAIADYYILNIYAAMWDWATWGNSANNYSFARERTPEGRWRPLVWDAEGSFNNGGGFNPVNFDIITQNLTGSDDTHNLAILWKRLVGVPPFTGLYRGSAEFRLLFADRINKLMFNGGVLDDRGATSRFLYHKNSLISELQPIASFAGAGTLNQSWFSTWTNASAGRRTYLFGPRANFFRNAGVWPATPPPDLTPVGGAVAAGASVTISGAGAGATIYFTSDGTDPRVEGGEVSATASVYSATIPLTESARITARIRSDSGEWSPVTQALYLVDPVAPSAANLVVAEVMYHPQDASAAEAAAGFTDADDFEFIRLQNIGSSPVDLANLEFTAGVIFRFGTGSVPFVEAGDSVVVVKRKSAFNSRYGTDLDGMIAGEFSGSLNNGGERITLEVTGASPSVVRDFAYSPLAPWPVTPDGDGPSLLLANPALPPDHTDALSWTASAVPGGQPSGAPLALTYEQWKSLAFTGPQAGNPAVSGLTIDTESDGLTNWAEYVLGGVPTAVDAAAHLPVGSIVNVGGEDYVALTYTYVTGANATLEVQVTDDFNSWKSGPPFTAPVGAPIIHGNGTTTMTVRDTVPMSSAGQRQIRLRMTAP
ncbi:MAG: lamin tail domain-containing protein, partial [Chthoniobacteraceae bacterium]